MVRLSVFCMLACILFAACSKNNDSDEQFLYGVWVKGNNPGDTLLFMNENGRHIFQFPASLSPAAAGYTKLPYRYQKKKLYVQLTTDAEYPLSSFTWKTEGRSFELQGNDLYPYMSSIAPKHTYTKVD